MPFIGPVVGGYNAQVDTKSYSNPPFDARIASKNPWFPPISRRGSIVQTKEWWSNQKSQNQPYSLRFLWNPSEISESESLATGQLPPGELTPAQAAAMTILPGLTTLNFQLLFDRTYEVMSGTTRFGVRDDIDALDRCVGIENNSGNILSVPLYFIFGPALQYGPFASGLTKTATPELLSSGNFFSPLTFLGYVSSINKVYSHFSSDMIPIRASVDITATQLITQDAYGQYTGTTALATGAGG